MLSESSPVIERTTPFDHAWLEAWGTAFLGTGGWRGPVQILEAPHQASGTTAVLALARRQRGPIAVPALGGYYWPARAVGLTGGRDVAAAAELADRLVAAYPRSFLRLGPVMEDDAGTQRLIRALLQRGWQGVHRELGVTMQLEARERSEQLLERASPSLLKNLAYLQRRLAKQHGRVQCTRHTLSNESAELLIERLSRIEASSWVAVDGEPKFMGEANRIFWRRLADESGVGWMPVIWTLQVGEVDVAFSAHLEADCRIWIVANSYVSDWKSYSPGSLLTLEVLRYADAHGVRLVDWGQGDSGYKGRWGALEGPHFQEHLLFPPGPIGWLLCVAAVRLFNGWRRS